MPAVVDKTRRATKLTPSQVTLRVHSESATRNKSKDLCIRLFLIGALSLAPSWDGVQPSGQLACEWKLKMRRAMKSRSMNAEKCDVQRNFK
jgi:hypothetical protein